MLFNEPLTNFNIAFDGMKPISNEYVDLLMDSNSLNFSSFGYLISILLGTSGKGSNLNLHSNKSDFIDLILISPFGFAFVIKTNFPNSFFMRVANKATKLIMRANTSIFTNSKSQFGNSSLA